jgi:hypothetical protein
VDRPLAVVNTATPATYWVSVDHLNRPVKMTTVTKASVWDASMRSMASKRVATVGRHPCHHRQRIA